MPKGERIKENKTDIAKHKSNTINKCFIPKSSCNDFKAFLIPSLRISLISRISQIRAMADEIITAVLPKISIMKTPCLK